MAMTHYKTLFSEYKHGPASFIHMLSKPIAAKRDKALNQNDTENLKEALAKSAKKMSTTLVFYGSHNTDKALELNHLAYHAKLSVCFIDCQKLADKYIGETEKHLSKLVAQAELENWILFFDEADALIGEITEIKDTNHKYANQEVSYLFKLLSQYPNLSILALTEKYSLEIIQYAVDSVISFR